MIQSYTINVFVKFQPENFVGVSLTILATT